MPEFKPKVEGSPPAEGNTNAEVSARRLKKREIDRKCQRQARERTRSRIAYLESLVDNLQQPDVDERSAALMKRLGEVEKERDALSHTLKGVQKAVLGLESLAEKQIKNHVNEDDANIPKPVDFAAQRTARNNSMTEMSSPDSPILADMNAPPPPNSQQSRNLSISAQSEPSRNDVPTQIHNDACECCRNGALSGPGTPKSSWRFANDTLMTNFKRLSPILPEEDLLSEDIPVRAVLEGWDSVAAQMELPASWKIMRRIDEQMFSKAGAKERLACLKMLHLMLQYHRDPTAERRSKLPPWYLARPSQASKPHAYAINYFVWPGVRERFIFEQHKYCGNLFATLFQTSLQILWPYDFRDCFAQRWDTGHYELSSAFRDAITDISKWTMRPELFQQFPDLRCDIPAFYNSPIPISNALQMQLTTHRTPSAIQSMHSSNKQTPVSNDGVSVPPMSLAESWMAQSTMGGWVDGSAYTQGFMDHNPLQANWSAG